MAVIDEGKRVKGEAVSSSDGEKRWRAFMKKGGGVVNRTETYEQ